MTAVSNNLTVTVIFADPESAVLQIKQRSNIHQVEIMQEELV